MNLLELRGPEFLAAYAALFAVAFALVFAARWLLRRPTDEPPAEAANLTPLEIAYLCDGPNRAIDTAILRLVHRGVLALDAEQGKLIRRAPELLTNPHPVEQAILNATEDAGGAAASAIRAHAAPAAEQLRERLEGLGLLVTPGQADLIRGVSALPPLAVIVLGVVKVILGLARGQPVAFLIAFLVASAVVVIVCSLLPLRRSRRGDRLVARLKDENAALEFSAKGSDNLPDSDLALAVAVFGPGVRRGKSW